MYDEEKQYGDELFIYAMTLMEQQEKEQRDAGEEENEGEGDEE
jgi:hypothetical protein